MNKKKAYYSVFVFLLLSLNILFAYLYFFTLIYHVIYCF